MDSTMHVAHTPSSDCLEFLQTQCRVACTPLSCAPAAGCPRHQEQLGSAQLRRMHTATKTSRWDVTPGMSRSRHGASMTTVLASRQHDDRSHITWLDLRRGLHAAGGGAIPAGTAPRAAWRKHCAPRRAHHQASHRADNRILAAAPTSVQVGIAQ